jgi:predicted RNA-binding Zn-ribbon protein involved in translation (DUF1610 family)
MVRRDKIVRFTCPGCHHVTMASMGVLNVTCSSCGKQIVETEVALDCMRTLFREHEDRRRGHAPLSTSGDVRPLLVGLALVTEGNLGLAGF